MTDIATLGLEIKSDGVVTASDRLKQLTAEGGRAEQATDKLSSSFQNATKYIQAAVAAMAAWKLTEYAKEATLLAARVETLGVVMKVVGNNAGYTGSQMEAYDKQVQKMGITTQESRANLIKMAGSQMDLAKATHLARVAQDAAVIGNINSSEAFGRMIQGIRSGETEILKNIGINVQFEQAYKKAAATLGKTAEQMTGTEKVTARMNAVLDYGKNIAGAYEASMGTAGKQLNSMARYTEELRLKFGETFTPALSFVVVELTNALKDADTILGNNKSTVDEWGQNFKSVVVSVAAEITRLSMLIDKAGGSMTSAAMLLFAPGAAMGNENSKKQFERFAQANMDYEARYKAGEDRLTRLAMSEMNPSTTGRTSAQEQASIDAAAQAKAKEAAEAAAEAAKKGAEAAAKWASTYEQLRKEIDLLNPSMTELDRKILDVTQKYADLERKKGANIEKLRQLKAEHVDAIRTQYEIAEAIKTTSNAFAEYLRIAGEETTAAQAAESMEDYLKGIRESIAAMDPAKKAAKDVADAVYDIGRAFEEADQAGAIESYINNLFRLKELQNSTADTTISMISDPYEQQTAMIEARYQREIELIGEKMNALREAGLEESAIYQALTEDVLTKAQKRDKDLLDNQLKQSKAGWDGVVAQAQKAFPKLTGLDKALNAVFKDHTKMRLSTEEERAKGAQKLVKDETRSNLSMYGAYAGAAGAVFEGLAATQDQTSRSGFETAKAFNIAAAVMSTAAAVMNAMASVPYPMNIAAAVTTGVMGAIQIATIASTTFGGTAQAPSIPSGSFAASAGGGAASSTIGSQIAYVQDPYAMAATEALQGLANAAASASLALGDVSKIYDKVGESFSTDKGQALAERGAWLIVSSGAKNAEQAIAATRNDPQLVEGISMYFQDALKAMNVGALALGLNAQAINPALGRNTTGWEWGDWRSGKTTADVAKGLQEILEIHMANFAAGWGNELLVYAKPFENASEAIQRLSTALYTFNDAAELAGITLMEGLAGGNWASAIIENIGGLEDFNTAMDSYFDAMFTSSEQDAMEAAKATREVSREFDLLAAAGINLEMPKTREEFRALVDSLDLMSDAGATAFVSLMSVAESFGTMMTAADEAAEKLREIQQGMEDLDVRYLNATGKGDEADALSRQLAGQREIEQAIADNMGDAYINRLREVLRLEEEAATANVQDMSQILAQRQSLQEQIDVLTGTRSQREIDLAKITDDTNRALQQRIWALQDEKTELDSATAVLRASFSAEKERLTTAYNAELAAMTTRLDATKTVVSDLTSSLNKLTAARERMRLTDDASLRSEYQLAQARLASVLVAARGGDLSGLKDIDSTLETLTGITAESYASSTDYQRDFRQAKNGIQELEKLTGNQLSDAQRQMELQQQQIDVLKTNHEGQLSALDAQLNALLNINNSVLSLSDAIAQFNSAKSTYAAAATATSADPIPADPIQNLYKSLLNRDADPAGYAYWQAKYTSGASLSDIADGFVNSAEYKNLHSYAVGTPYVPYDMTANIHQGEIVMDRASSDVLRKYGIPTYGSADNSDLVAEVRALRTELRAAQTEIAKNTLKTARYIERWDGDGLPEERAVA